MTVIPTNIFGEFDNFSIENGHVIPGLMHKCYLAKKNKTDFTIWGSGTPLRQFLYAKDLGKLFLWTLKNYDENEPIILSVPPEAEVSIKDVALAIAKAMKFEGNVVFDTSKADGQFKKTASNAKLMKLNPDFQFTPIEEALRSSVEWFEANFETCRK